jgi:hypothetical protein
MKRSAAIGAIVWCGLFIAAIRNDADLTWLELVFLFAPLVIVPLGLHLTRCQDSAESIDIDRSERLARILQSPAALLAAVAFFLPGGRWAATFAVPWLFVCLLCAISGLIRIFRGAYARLDRVCVAISLIYLAVGGAWLFASRLGLNPMGFQEPIVLLTAIHFHYAGFAAPLLARSAARAVQSKSSVSYLFARLVALGVLAGPGVLSLGFILGPRVKLAAALILAASEIGLAIAFICALPHIERISAEVLLTLSAASVGFSMVLAAVWAIGEYPLQPFVHLAEMEKFHGTANAFGFTLCGLLGWILASANAKFQEVRP